MITFHQIAQLHEAPERSPPRAPLAAALRPRPSRVPFEGPCRKWWAVEARFDRPLTRREVRVLERAYGSWASPLYGAFFGADGMVWNQWWNKWPSASEDGANLLAAMQRVGVPGVVRAAPFGRDCPGGEACPIWHYHDPPSRFCRVGANHSGSPVFRDADWIAVFPPLRGRA